MLVFYITFLDLLKAEENITNIYKVQTFSQTK